MKKMMFVASALMSLCLVACHSTKEGEFDPKMKISKVYEIEDGARHLIEDWSWNDGLLQAIVYPEDESTMYFKYDDDRLVRAEMNNAEKEVSYLATYTYDGNYLSKVMISYYGEEEMAFEMKRNSKDVLTQINVTIYDSDEPDPDDDEDYDDEDAKKSAWAMDQALSKMLHPEVAKYVKQVRHMAKKNAKGAKFVTTVPLMITWDGDNISKLSASLMGSTLQMTMQYDDKKNPRKGLFLAGDESLMGDLFEFDLLAYSKNNATKLVYVEDGDEEVTTMTYEYNKKDYPTKVTYKNAYPYQEDEDITVNEIEYLD